MSPNDEPRFLYALASMEMYFRDKLSKDYRRLYFKVVSQAGWTIEEWEAACMMAMDDETFHAVPLAGVMKRYLNVLREEQRERRAEQELREREQRKQLYAAERDAEHRQRQIEALEHLEASQAKLASLWGKEWLEQHKRMMDPNNVEEKH